MDNVSRFKSDLRALCKKHKIKLKLINSNAINYDDTKINVSGYFDTGEGVLAVATKKDKKEWLEILIHESCHLDQYIENAKCWQELEILGVDVNAILDLWLSKNIEMTDKQVQAVMKKIIDCERDCDLRAIEKIKKYKLENIIDLQRYVKKANAYHLSYYAVRKLRRWNKKLKAAYQVEEVLQLFPSTMNKGYSLTKKQYLTMAKKCYFDL